SVSAQPYLPDRLFYKSAETIFRTEAGGCSQRSVQARRDLECSRDCRQTSGPRSGSNSTNRQSRFRMRLPRREIRLQRLRGIESRSERRPLHERHHPSNRQERWSEKILQLALSFREKGRARGRWVERHFCFQSRRPLHCIEF